MSTPERMMSVAPQGPNGQNEPSDEKSGRLKRWEEELRGYLKNIPHKDNDIHIIAEVIVEEAEEIGKEIRSIGRQMREGGDAGSLDKKYEELRAVIDRAKAMAEGVVDEGADERAIDEQRKNIHLPSPFGTRSRRRGS